MKHIMLSAAALFAAAFTSSVFAQTPTYAVSFDGIPVGENITKDNTNLTWTRTAGGAPYTGALTAMQSTFGAGGSLRLFSSGYGSTPNLVGVGANNLAKSSVYSLSLNLSSDLWQTGTATYIMMGDWTATSQQVYNPDSTAAITTQGYSLTTIAQQSLFSLVVFGSSGSNGAYLRTINSAGAFVNLTGGDGKNIVLENGESYNLHIVANGGASAITLGTDTIAAGMMGIYLEGSLVSTAVICDSTDATAFRVVSAGNSVGNLQNNIEVGGIQLWDSAVAPVPESAATALLLGAGALLVVLRRRR